MQMYLNFEMFRECMSGSPPPNHETHLNFLYIIVSNVSNFLWIPYSTMFELKFIYLTTLLPIEQSANFSPYSSTN